ncbi:uncharacterized protein LOC122536251 isoform X1 [Frieseomelitta varia]|uniref:uncharacterized protein LOC122536251 isoform X1 n=1 Tax=Frieseomelitta varia TaxID=561572 RepID=UPI001CB6881C|nr:uncharacterized protein LOC122536251 isoform X1 [Frieseomelitta varia]
MPDSGAVYQPTTVGYTYDSGGDGTGGSNNLRGCFWRIISRHKLSSRNWLEWILVSAVLSFIIAGITMITTDPSRETKINITQKVDEDPTMSQSDEEHTKYTTKHSMPPGIFLILTGLVLGLIWAWLHFFHRAKSTRGGMVLSSGQMLGGLNPSTDFLVGSTSQYGPVLTELPNQLTMKLEQTSPHDTPAIPLSDQEEETRTLMQDSTIPTVVSIGPNTIANQKG